MREARFFLWAAYRNDPSLPTAQLAGFCSMKGKFVLGSEFRSHVSRPGVLSRTPVGPRWHTRGHTRTHTQKFAAATKGKSSKRACCCNVTVLDVRAVVPCKNMGKPAVRSFVLWGFPSPCLDLARRKAIPRKDPAPRDSKRPKHAPRSPAGAQHCSVVYTRAPSVPRSREREKRPAA